MVRLWQLLLQQVLHLQLLAEIQTRKQTIQINSQLVTVNRSGSEEARWDKVQELVEKTELNWNSRSLQITHNQIKQLPMVIDASNTTISEQLNKETVKTCSAIADTYSPIRLYSGKNGEENKYTGSGRNPK